MSRQAGSIASPCDAETEEEEELRREALLFSGLQHNATFQLKEKLCVNLFQNFVDWQNVHCLNDSYTDPFPSRDWRAVRPRNGQKFVASAGDPQMIIHIPFKRKVKLMGLTFSVDPELIRYGPATVHLFKDLPALDFNDVEEVTPLYTFHLKPEDLCHDLPSVSTSDRGAADSTDREAVRAGFSGQLLASQPHCTRSVETLGPISAAQSLPVGAIPLPVRLFGVTSSLWMFIENNQGNEDITRLSSLQVWGVPLEDLNVKHIHR